MRYILGLIISFAPALIWAQQYRFDSLVEESRIIALGENHSRSRTTTELVKNIINAEHKSDTVFVILEIPFSIAEAINQSIHAQDLQKLKRIVRLDPLLKNESGFFMWVAANNKINEKKVIVKGCEAELFPEMLLYYINYVSISTLNVPDVKIKILIDSLRDQDLRYQKDTWISAYLLRVRQEFNADSIACRNFFGDEMYCDLVHALALFNSDYRYWKIQKEAFSLRVMIFRDSVMCVNLKYIYANASGQNIKFLIALGKAHVNKNSAQINYNGWVPCVECFTNELMETQIKVLTVDLCYEKKREKRNPKIPLLKELHSDIIAKSNNITVCRVRL